MNKNSENYFGQKGLELFQFMGGGGRNGHLSIWTAVSEPKKQ